MVVALLKSIQCYWYKTPINKESRCYCFHLMAKEVVVIDLKLKHLSKAATKTNTQQQNTSQWWLILTKTPNPKLMLLSFESFKLECKILRLSFPYSCPSSLSTHPPMLPLHRTLGNKWKILRIIKHYTFSQQGCFSAQELG